MLGLRRVGVAMLVLVGCVALSVGSVSPVSAAPRMWRRVASPSVNPNNHANFLSDVSCVRTDWCVAVGQAQAVASAGNGTRAVIEQWDGSAWSMVTPANDGMQSGLRGVTCLADDDCTTVGSSTPPPDASGGTLVEHWNGSTWAVVPSPNQDANGDALNDVACATPTMCFAVGSGDPSHFGGPTALLEQWDGAHWTVVPSLVAGSSSELFGVACPSATLCVAVGNEVQGIQRTITLTEMWNGASWSIVKSPNLPTSSKHATNSLNGVACPSPTDCVAVGALYVGKTSTTLAERWNGKQWHLMTTPTVPAGSAFAGVNCVGTYCAAVGYSGIGDNGSSTLVETLRGHTFTVVPSASPGAGYNFLSSVACADVGTCVAVGDWGNAVAPPWERTLVLSS